MEVKTKDLVAAITYAEKACGQMVRYSDMVLDCDGSILSVVGTDGIRMHISEIGFVGQSEPWSFGLAHWQAVAVLAGIKQLSKSKDAVSMAMDGDWLSIGNNLRIKRYGNLRNWRCVVPDCSDGHGRWEFDCREALAALKPLTVGPSSRETHGLIGRLGPVSFDIENESGKRAIIEMSGPSKMDLTILPAYLADAMPRKGMAEMFASTPRRAVMIKAGNNKAVIMPVACFAPA